MRSLLVCPDDFLFRLLRGTPTPGEPPLYPVEDRGLPAPIPRPGAAPLAGDLEDPPPYPPAFRPGPGGAPLRAGGARPRAPLAPADRLLILLQDDPDPDAIASALALRTLLGRHKTSAPIATFGGVTRPENRAMIKILEIEVEVIEAGDVDAYD